MTKDQAEKEYAKLMAAYEKAVYANDRARLGTMAHEKAGKRLDKTCEALEQFRATNKQFNF